MNKTLFAAAMALLLGACASTPSIVRAPQGFEGQSQSLPAANRSRATGLLVDESFDLGPYRATQVKHDVLSSGNKFTLGSFSTGSTSKGFRFSFVGGSGSESDLSAHCEAVDSGTSVPLMGVVKLEKSSFSLQCACDGEDSKSMLTIVRHYDWGALQPNRNVMMVEVNGSSYMLRPYGLMGQLVSDDEPFMGYRLDGSSGPAAALAPGYPGTVWIHDSLAPSQRKGMSCALAALMIHRGPG